MSQLLEANQISIHSYIVAELALGMLAHRAQTLALFNLLPRVRLAQLDEVMQLIEARSLYGKGIGLVDAHLIASTYLTPSTQLWTRDKHLRSLAHTLGLHTEYA